MRVLVRSKLTPAQRGSMPTFGEHRAIERAQRLKKLASQKRIVASAAGVVSDATVKDTLEKRSARLTRSIDRLQSDED